MKLCPLCDVIFLNLSCESIEKQNYPGPDLPKDAFKALTNTKSEKKYYAKRPIGFVFFANK